MYSIIYSSSIYSIEQTDALTIPTPCFSSDTMALDTWIFHEWSAPSPDPTDPNAAPGAETAQSINTCAVKCDCAESQKFGRFCKRPLVMQSHSLKYQFSKLRAMFTNLHSPSWRHRVFVFSAQGVRQTPKPNPFVHPEIHSRWSVFKILKILWTKYRIT